jgi:mediator of RNA polymerase II transcription subunit 21
MVRKPANLNVMLWLNRVVEPYSEDVFEAGQRELAQDLILREQQIELLVSTLPGLDHSQKYQEQRILGLEKELKAAEEERKLAVKEKEETLSKLEEVIRSIKRP